MSCGKPFEISKVLVFEAYRRVKQNKGAAGVDGESIQQFEGNLKDNLYKLWNRLSSGSYFPPPVKTVQIPKSTGGVRKLGVPTVSDRIAQMVVKMVLEPKLEPHFHPNSYGYRPGKSALEAVGLARSRCWAMDWVIDLDIQGFFDNLNHELMMKALHKHTKSRWILLYVERWLKAPAMLEDGSIVQRDKGTPQGGVISPLLSNLFLHYALDQWLEKNHPQVCFERYADDVLVHCRTVKQAQELLEAISNRLQQCALQLNPSKTRLVYCKDAGRKGQGPHQSFDFLGYTFRARTARSWKGKLFDSFLPAISDRAIRKVGDNIRSWKLPSRTRQSVQELAKWVNPTLRGWVNYYGHYYKSALYAVFRPLERVLQRWARKKYKKLRTSYAKASRWLAQVRASHPDLFAHWQLGQLLAVG